MKKIILSLILCSIAIIAFTGCDIPQVNVNVSNNESISSNQFGQFVLIGKNLVYDSATRIVYIKSRTYGDYSYTPYYAPNGFPYRYNPETNTFEEIVNEGLTKQKSELRGRITMTYKHFLNTTTDENKLATFLFNFSSSFYLEKLEGICDKPCGECGDSCYDCIVELMNKEMDDKLLSRR